jgi:hypothetical protein
MGQWLRHCRRVLAKDYPDGEAALNAQRAYLLFKQRLLTLDSVALVRAPRCNSYQWVASPIRSFTCGC